jgi:hypothetical protein
VSVTKKIAARLAKTAYVQRALKERQDIRSIRRKPTARFYTGLFLILFSYVIGWPAVAVLGFIAFHLNNPLIAVIGGPVTYGMSHLVFMIGAYLAGAEYVAVVLQWATRVAIEKVLGCPEDAGSQGQLDQHGNSP